MCLSMKRDVIMHRHPTLNRTDHEKNEKGYNFTNETIYRSKILEGDKRRFCKSATTII